MGTCGNKSIRILDFDSVTTTYDQTIQVKSTTGITLLWLFKYTCTIGKTNGKKKQYLNICLEECKIFVPDGISNCLAKSNFDDV